MNMMVSRVQMLKPRQLDGEMGNTYHYGILEKKQFEKQFEKLLLGDLITS